MAIKQFKLSKVCKYLLIIICLTTFSVNIVSCNKDGLTHIGNTISLNSRLSDYHIFQGNPSDLNPAADFHLYELATTLFTDYAEKQRLIKIPAGFTMSAQDAGLLNFPDGTILVKTFFYYHDKRDSGKGKEIIETRLLIKSGGGWNAGTYVWDEDHYDAQLLTTGLNKTLNWIDNAGSGHVISYHVPAMNECSTCHQSGNSIIPIGPKMRNLNRLVSRNNTTVNQLKYFCDIGVLDSLNPDSYITLPDWENPVYTLEQRARAYMDVNCAHCHNENGFASDVNLHLAFEKTLGESNIRNKKSEILERFKEGTMPKLGTSIVHTEALELIQSYIHSLN